ncbi:MAG: hypothetical protein LC772_01010 [Chloroflexi bacterium]|nr:hypothetical protein [Chloroflexota bacterium]
MSSRRKKLLIGSAVVFAVCIIVFVNGIVSSIEIPFNQMIGECPYRSQTLRFVCPPGRLFRLVVGIWEKATTKRGYREPEGASFLVSITVQSAGQTVWTGSATQATAEACNWLDDDRFGGGPGKADYLAGYIIEGHRPELKRLLKPHQVYNVRVTFQERPPPRCSLWLSGLRSARLARA